MRRALLALGVMVTLGMGAANAAHPTNVTCDQPRPGYIDNWMSIKPPPDEPIVIIRPDGGVIRITVIEPPRPGPTKGSTSYPWGPFPPGPYPKFFK